MDKYILRITALLLIPIFFSIKYKKKLRIISGKLQHFVFQNRSSSCDHKISFHQNGFDLDNHIPFKCWYILEC